MSRLVWPIALQDTRRVGESVTARRAGSGRPHKGIDLFADPGTKVLSADYGHVARVVDGRAGDRESLLRAGLFVDVISFYGWVYRYLRSAAVREGDLVRAGDPLGTVSMAGQSGVEHSDPHVHFEIRVADWDRIRGDYGDPIDPLTVLPRRSWLA